MAENYAQEIFPTQAYWVLARLQLESSARTEAFDFVFQSKLDAETIRAEIDDREATIANLAEMVNGPMKPGAHPRIYQDAYLAGLREALSIIDLSITYDDAKTETSPELMLAEKPKASYGDSSTS
ncbi:MAG: hypothetical protein HC853_12455 [Anaerolineae bacterium]|nr:hypothetical protein [Anaerolineae bacterium]